jgi:hypothetical protein
MNLILQRSVSFLPTPFVALFIALLPIWIPNYKSINQFTINWIYLKHTKYETITLPTSKNEKILDVFTKLYLVEDIQQHSHLPKVPSKLVQSKSTIHPSPPKMWHWKETCWASNSLDWKWKVRQPLYLINIAIVHTNFAYTWHFGWSYYHDKSFIKA